MASCPRGVTFDGTNDYLTRGADLDGSANNSQGTCFFWVKLDAAGDGVRQRILNSGNAAVILERTAANRFQIFVANGALTATLGGALTRTSSDGWMSVMMSWDTNFSAGNKLMNIWVNDTDDSGVKTDASAAFAVDYTSTDWGIGARPSDGANKLNGDLADFWFAEGVYFDFSIESNRRKFIASNHGAVDLGADGSKPTGTAPIVFMRGPASAFATNLGTGGNFTVTGALDDSLTNPPCSIGGASSDYGKRRPRRIMLPDGRIVTPKSQADYRRIVGKILEREAPDLVEVAAKPVTVKKRSRSIGKTEPDYRIDDAALAAVTRLTETSDMLSMQALIAELTFKGYTARMEQEDEAAMIAILTELA